MMVVVLLSARETDRRLHGPSLRATRAHWPSRLPPSMLSRSLFGGTSRRAQLILLTEDRSFSIVDGQSSSLTDGIASGRTDVEW